jgi:FSR family fosmidomycin resistance protein-like MFS transporter
MLLFLQTPEWLLAPMLILLGLTTIAPQPVLLALTQDQFPHPRALANGLFLALSFLIRAGAIWTIGAGADALGLTTAFTIAALVGLLGAPAVILLHRAGL